MSVSYSYIVSHTTHTKRHNQIMSLSGLILYLCVYHYCITIVRVIFLQYSKNYIFNSIDGLCRDSPSVISRDSHTKRLGWL